MSFEWLLIRGSGIVAFALLAASVIWGLLLSSKLLGRLVKAKPLTWFHESLGVSALIATLVHMVALAMHDYLEFGWDEILVPGRSDWRPLPVALGVVSFYAIVVVVGSFYVKRWIGQRAWRTIHFVSFGVFVAVLLHGMKSGTDTDNSWMIGLYLGSAIIVFSLVAHRLMDATGTSKATAREEAPV